MPYVEFYPVDFRESRRATTKSPMLLVSGIKQGGAYDLGLQTVDFNFFMWLFVRNVKIEISIFKFAFFGEVDIHSGMIFL